MEAEVGIEPTHNGFANHDFHCQIDILKKIARKLPFWT